MRTWLIPTCAVLDVGCGSGILGIAALTFGARSARGIDINPAASLVCRANAESNAVSDQWSVNIFDLDEKATIGLLVEQPKGFDVITANILAPVLIRLAPHFLHLLSANGTLIVKGS